jgi:hypothetical protein
MRHRSHRQSTDRSFAWRSLRLRRVENGWACVMCQEASIQMAIAQMVPPRRVKRCPNRTLSSDPQSPDALMGAGFRLALQSALRVQIVPSKTPQNGILGR